jgi:hypothetical protein
MRVLVARWATDGNATLQPPALLWWNEGTPATLDHYEHHVRYPLLGHHATYWN